MSAYIDPNTFDAKRIRFGEPQPNKDLPGSFRISMRYNGEPLTFLTDWLFTFGISENLNYNDKTTVEGYSLPLCMTDMDSPTQNQMSLISAINAVSEAAQNYLISVRKVMKRFTMDAGDFKKFNPLYYKLDEEGVPVPGRGPTLYVKLRCTVDKKNKDVLPEIISEFYEGNSREPSDPLKFMGVRGKVRALFSIDSVFVGSTAIRLQIRLTQAVFKPQTARGRAIPVSEEPESDGEAGDGQAVEEGNQPESASEQQEYQQDTLPQVPQEPEPAAEYQSPPPPLETAPKKRGRTSRKL